MNSHVSAILLGVKDMERSKRFYTDGLGWTVQHDYKISVFFVPHGGSIVGFYGRDGLADSVGVTADGNGFSGVVFNYVVRSEERVDEVMDEAKNAGGKILKPAAKPQWGGYGGSFADPDGYIWSIGYSAEGTNQPYAEYRGDRSRVAGDRGRTRHDQDCGGHGEVWLRGNLHGRARRSPPRAPPARRSRDSRTRNEPQCGSAPAS